MLTTDVLKNERGGIERRIVALRLDLAQAEGALKFLDYLTEKSKAAEPSEDKPEAAEGGPHPDADWPEIVHQPVVPPKRWRKK
jgi:hypothetical protein